MARCDLHTHICKTDIQDMLLACRNKGIGMMGVCEHVYQIAEIRWMLPDFLMEGRLYSLQEYLEIFQSQAGQSPRLLQGIELDILPGISGRIWERLSRIAWDYVIAALHEFNGWDIHFPHNFDEAARHEQWRTCLNLQRAFLEEFHPVILGHPLRMAVTIPEVPPDFEDHLGMLVEAAKRFNCAIEINGRDYTISAALTEQLIRQCARTGCMVTLGSDAHIPEAIETNFDEIEKLLSKHSIDQTFIFQNGKATALPRSKTI